MSGFVSFVGGEHMCNYEIHPVYDDFSLPCYDGRHDMILGGSFISTGDEASTFARFHFRRHFLQHSGFRLVTSNDEIPATFLNEEYQNSINEVVAALGQGPVINVNIDGTDEKLQNDPEITQSAQGQTFEIWFDSIVNLSFDPTRSDMLTFPKADLEMRWNKSIANGGSGLMREDGPISFQTSEGITAYNIKEDWFFDKERSVLDKRIIAIAPVCKYTKTEPKQHKELRGNMVVFRDGVESFYSQESSEFAPLETESTIQLEMFWLYFPDLRNVMVNYYTYNDRSDAQWMSFDDLFWKRKYNAQIYRTSDKFDRDIEDYRFGVDALYEAEKVKGEIRKWEHDVWNY